MMEYINLLEVKNSSLQSQALEMNNLRQKHESEMEILTSQVEAFKLQQHAHPSGDDQQSASIQQLPVDVEPSSSAATSRKGRVQIENEEFSRRLGARIIDGFVKSSLFDNRRQFPLRRIAKIVLESFVSFEWMHAELATYTSSQTPSQTLRNPITKWESLVQSRNLCFPLRIVIAKDSKKTLDGFWQFYSNFSTGAIALALNCKDFKMSFSGDMKLQWQALNAGGAAKVKEKFCFAFSSRSKTLHVPQVADICEVCIDRNAAGHTEAGQHGDPLLCYHYPFLEDPEVRAKLADKLGVLSNLLDV